MSLNLLRVLFALGLTAVAGHGRAAPVSLPNNYDPSWQDISNIVWSTDNGGSWGNAALDVGQTVEFKFTMHKYADGTHYADFLKAWIDLNGDQQFQDGESLVFGYHVTNPTNAWHPDHVVNESFEFTSAPRTVTDAMVGDQWLLARVTCSESLLNGAGIGAWDEQWNPLYTSNDNAWYGQHFSATADYFQGESELVRFSVNRVPEPGTLALFAAAMAGMASRRKPATRV